MTMTPNALDKLLIQARTIARGEQIIDPDFGFRVANLIASYEAQQREIEKMRKDLKHANRVLERLADQFTDEKNDIVGPLATTVELQHDFAKEVAIGVVTDVLEGVAELLREASPAEVVFDGTAYP